MSYTLILMIFTFALSLKVYQHKYIVKNVGLTGSVELVYYALFLTGVFLISYRYIGSLGGENYGGIDSIPYKLMYEYAGVGYIESIKSQTYEPGFASIVWLFSSLGFSYENYQMVLYVFFGVSFYKILQKTDINKYTPLIIFLGMLYILGSVNILRITVAIFVFYYAMFSLKAEKHYLAVVLSLFAILVHISSIVPVLALVFMHITKKTSSKKYVALYLIAAAGISLFSFSVLSTLLAGTKYGVYVTEEKIISLNTYISAFFLLLFLRKRFFKRSGKYVAMMSDFIMTIFLTLPIYFAFPIAYRFLLFYLPAMYFVLPSLLVRYSPNSWSRMIYAPVYCGVLAFIVLKIYYAYTAEFENYGRYILNY